MGQTPVLKNKLFLYLTEFFAGMSVMAVELGASRLLAPYFSSSQIVWTIIIGTIMIAMALGNVYGGRSADKKPDPDRLYRRILIAAVWIAAIPVVGKYIVLGISALLIFTVSTNFLIWAAFAACMVIFVFPLFLLGTVTPSLAKYSVDSLAVFPVIHDSLDSNIFRRRFILCVCIGETHKQSVIFGKQFVKSFYLRGCFHDISFR